MNLFKRMCAGSADRKEGASAPSKSLQEPWKEDAADSIVNKAYNELVESGIARKGAFRSRQYRASRVGAHPLLAEFLTAFEQELWARDIPFVVHQVVRSAAEQNALYEKGVTRAKAGQSPHQSGCAADLIHYTRGWELHDDPVLARLMWEIVGAIGKEVARRKQIPIEWGGDFKTFKDPAHWQLAKWKEYARRPPF